MLVNVIQYLPYGFLSLNNSFMACSLFYHYLKMSTTEIDFTLISLVHECMNNN